MTKDKDFADLVQTLGPPPQVIWLTFGNTSNLNLRRILKAHLKDALELLRSGDALVEVQDSRSW